MVPNTASGSTWLQRALVLPARPTGLHLITAEVVGALPELAQIEVGLLHAFLQHTSAGLAISENADPDVPLDLESALDRLAPEGASYRHSCEGPDDMPAHVKAALMGCSLVVPVAAGRLALGTWQGIFLCEHRRRGGSRRLLLTLWGQTSPRR